MSVLDLCRNVRSQWAAFSRMIWPEDSRQLTRTVLDRLGEDLARRYAGLLRRRRRIEAVRDRLDRHPHANPDSVARQRDRLARLEDAYARRRQTFARRKALHKALLDGRVVACPDPTGVDPT